MTDQIFERIVCWKDYRINQVINTEAVAVDRENFLASHAPFRRIKYSQVSREIPDTSEEAFLAELNRQAASDQHVFAVILGIPGTGKSHLIRWIKEKYTQTSQNEVIC
jgi:Cdc6-like AAA superfamily ATPase